jgi:hypothetical protein
MMGVQRDDSHLLESGAIHFSVQRGVHEADQIDHYKMWGHTTQGQKYEKKTFLREYICGCGMMEGTYDNTSCKLKWTLT